MIRPLSDSKNPAGAGIFAERRIRSFSGIKRVSKPFLISVPLTCSLGKAKWDSKGLRNPLDGELLKGVCIPLLSVVDLACKALTKDRQDKHRSRKPGAGPHTKKLQNTSHK